MLECAHGHQRLNVSRLMGIPGPRVHAFAVLPCDERGRCVFNLPYMNEACMACDRDLNLKQHRCCQTGQTRSTLCSWRAPCLWGGAVSLWYHSHVYVL